MEVVLAFLLQLVKLCITIGFVVATQGSPGLIIFPSPANLHGYPFPIETPGSSHQRDSHRTIAPSSPSISNGPFSHPPIGSSPPYEVVPSPSTVQGNVTPPKKAPAVRPPVSTVTAPGSVPSPLSTPSRIIHPVKGGAPVAAPLYKTPKPLPAKIHSPVLTPSVSNYKHHHKRNIITVPAPAPSYIVSPPISKPRDRAIPPSLSPKTGGQRHHVPLPWKSVSPLSSPIHSNKSQFAPAPSPSIKFGSHPTKSMKI